jgi:anti-sigma factor ChrR (cupin superfamily)
MSRSLNIIIGTTLGALAFGARAGATTVQKTELIPSVSSVAWKPAPATLPKGTQIVLLAGDPSKPGPFVLRLKFPPNTLIAPHRHATAENVTVLTGHFYHEVGEKVVRADGKDVAGGGFVYLPGMTPHSLWTTNEETIVQVTGTGPFGLLYVDPKDDPSKAH